MPDAAEVFTLASRHLQAGRPQEAEPLLRALARADPPHAPALHLLGVRAYQEGNAAAACDLFAAAVQARPANAGYQSCLGAAYQELGRLDDAVACHRAALDRDPASTLALTNLGVTLMALGQIAEATAAFDQAWRRDPNDAAVACNLAAARQAAGATDEALTLFRAALGLDPRLAQAHNNLGRLLEERGERSEAETRYRRGVELDPRLVQGYLNLGGLWKCLGRTEHVVRLFRQGVQFCPHAWELHARLADALLTANRAHEALASCRQALALRPDEAQLHNHLGNACNALGRLDEAVAAYERARQLRQDWSVPRYNLGVALQAQGRLAEAQTCFREALRLNPGDAVAHSTYVGSLHYDPRVDGLTLLAEHRRWAEKHAPATPAAQHANSRVPDRRLRVGYVSPDFRNHAVAFFLEPILAHHDPNQFETFAYAEVPAPDDRTARLRDRVANWRDTHGLSDDDLAEQIRADAIDVLVDLGGHLAGNRLLALSRKPAPVQLTYLGYPGTTGLPAFDYRIGDAVTDPPGAEAWHSEELVRLELPFCCYAPPPLLHLADAPPAEVQGVITFGALHKLEKLNDDVLDVWCELLRDVPGSRLLLARNTLHGDTAAALAGRFAARGIGPERLFLRRVESAHLAHLLAYNAVDVALDAFPWSGHTTACEALWMGVPVVTLRGDRTAGRLTASVLETVGLAELIADTPAAYRQVAAALAQDGMRRRHWRQTLRGRLLASPLCDGRAFTRKLEDTYRRLWRRWCSAQVR